ncbi:MAG: hypothetical protein WBM55_00355 [Muriicola sp.]
MKYLLFIFIIGIQIVLASCNQNQTELDFEKSVAYEIFPLLIEKIHFDRRLLPPPPPVPHYNDTNQLIGYDTIMSDSILKEWKHKAEELKADTVRLVIAINDSTESLKYEDYKFLLKRYIEKEIIFKKIDLSEKYKIDLERLVADPKLKFKYRSNFPSKSNIWNEEYNFHLSGIIGFSRILFDQSKEFGILSTGFGCGKLCGTGYLVLIKKVNKKWMIDKMIITEEA